METPANRQAVDVSPLIVRLILGTPGKPGMGLVGVPVAIGQFLGGLGILVGVLTRFSSAAIVVIMVGAILMVHLPQGFKGCELCLALIGLALTVLVAGPGRYTVARVLPFLGRAGEAPSLAFE